LPLLEDANSVQVALMKVIQALGSGRVDHKTAGLILYALQTASVNLRNVHFEVRNATDVVIDRDTVNATSIGGPQWFEEDFEEEVEDEVEDEVAAEADGEDPSGDGEGTAEPGRSEAPEVKQISIEEARMQVQGVVRNWLLERAENVTVKPG
jgi:hypothetical protein